METHVKVLGALNIAFGALGLLAGVRARGDLQQRRRLVSANADADAAIAIPIIGLTGFALVTFLVTLSVPGVIIGLGLLNLRPWARVGGIVVSILMLMGIPFGTILGVYGIWVLFSKDTERLIHGRARFAADLAELTSKRNRTTRSGASTTQPELFSRQIRRASTPHPAVSTANARMTRSRAL